MFDAYKDVVSVDELCQMLRIGKNVAYQLLHEEQIKAIRVGRQFRIPKKNVLEYLDKG